MRTTTDLDNLALLGVDVGFSLRRRTTGIAWSFGGCVNVTRTYSDWDRRKPCLPADTIFDTAAIDGPLLPITSSKLHPRSCEYLFIGGAYAKRCKPGLSHFGSGLQLRRAAGDTANQIRSVVKGSNLIAPKNQIVHGKNIIEAFPNAFLGVMLDKRVYETRPRLRRGKKFDWLYREAVGAHLFDALLDRLNWKNVDLAKQLNDLDPKRYHEEAAALVCLLTAACAASAKTEIVGDAVGGWFWLPPIDIWADWAREERLRLASAAEKIREGSLADFFARSPLRGSGLITERRDKPSRRFSADPLDAERH